MTSATTGIRGDESALIGRLTLEQKVRLLTGADSWHMNGESAVGLRPIVMSDGPAGVRGTRFDSRSPSSSLPCPIALGATWDEQLVHDLAFALGQETRGKGVDVLLAPTINIVRTPLSGRGFECFSEDPLLTTRIAVAYVRGVQEAGAVGFGNHLAHASFDDRGAARVHHLNLGAAHVDADDLVREALDGTDHAAEPDALTLVHLDHVAADEPGANADGGVRDHRRDDVESHQKRSGATSAMIR